MLETIMLNRFFMAKRALPTDGLIFYASLNGNTPTKAETGQTLTKSLSTVKFLTYKGIDCCYLPAAGYLDVTGDFSACFFPTAMTASFWAYKKNTGTRAYIGYNDTTNLSVNTNANRQWLAWSAPYVTTVSASAWHHMLAYTGDSYKTVHYYLDGVYKGFSTRNERNVNLPVSDMVIGSNIARAYHNGPAYIAGMRLYNRALTQSEITALAGEYKPTT